MTTTSTISYEVRVLPFRVRPLPDEPFDSWLEKMAATYGATMNEMACALGLIEQQAHAPPEVVLHVLEVT